MKNTLLIALLCASTFAMTPLRAEEPYELSEKTKQEVKDFSEDLKGEDSFHFMSIYSAHNIIQTASIVHQDIEKAVKACGENNPTIKEDMDKQYKSWSETVDPALERAQNFLDNKIIAQDYAKPKEVKALLKKSDKTRDAYREKFKKVPVTSEESCTYLMHKMDETKVELSSLLETTLMPMPDMSEIIPKEEKKEETKTEEKEPETKEKADK